MPYHKKSIPCKSCAFRGKKINLRHQRNLREIKSVIIPRRFACRITYDQAIIKRSSSRP